MICYVLYIMFVINIIASFKSSGLWGGGGGEKKNFFWAWATTEKIFILIYKGFKKYF